MEANLAPSWPSREGAAPAAPLQRPAEEIELPLEEAVAQAEEADEVMAAGLRSGGGAYGGGVGDRLGAERRGRWQRRPARQEARAAEMEAGLAREALPMEGGRIGARGTSGGGGRLVREARPAVEEATLVRGGAAGGCGAVFGARRLASGGRRCRGPTYQQRLSGGGALVRQPWIRRW
uniref:Uncharacterized protein n=2 Tax=Oryza sativa subsp. japonica TaxID=39947 RepID=Q10J73_ORYSJ|nr:hypothetical protein [Oryza sativa Japonica Group]ABF96765.1 hypothetical protein LOC_Os03g31700 [Oryza sativa Japonica Group]